MNTNIELLSKLGNSKKPGLIKLKSALSLFDNPHEKLSNCILISGTNGKGTVARTLSDILKTSRYKVGLYTSPHLIRINERIRINNKEISSKQLNNLIGEVTSKINVRLSYFELLTLVSIVHFHRNKNDINTVLNRDQTEEWKGWMQYLFLAYHYFHEKEVYNAIRIFISCYVERVFTSC